MSVVTVHPCVGYASGGPAEDGVRTLRDEVLNRIREFDGKTLVEPPNWVYCSMCFRNHEVSINELNKILYTGTGAIDKSATYNYLVHAVINDESNGAAGAGAGDLNGFNANSDVEVFDLVKPEEEEEEEGPNLDPKKSSSEKSNPNPDAESKLILTPSKKEKNAS